MTTELDLYNVLITLATTYDSKKGTSVDEYINSITAIYDERNILTPTTSLSLEAKEVLKLLIENPEVLHEVQTNVFGREIIDMALTNPEKMNEFKELVEELKSGTFKLKIPDKLKN